MKKLMMLVCTLMIATVATVTLAGQAKTGPKGKYSGTVASYDSATKVLTLKKGDRDSTFQIKDESQVLMGKTKADAAAFAAGQTAKVEYVMDGAMKVIQKVELSGASK